MDARPLLAFVVALSEAFAQPAAPEAPRARPPEVIIVEPRDPDEAPEWARSFVPRADDPRLAAYREHRRRLVELERSLNAVRARHLGSMRHEGRRDEGIGLMLDIMREFDDPSSYAVALKVFAREKMDVRSALLDHIAGAATMESDATLAWIACHDADEAMRDAALDLLAVRADANGVHDSVRLVLDQALRTRSDTVAANAAAAVRTLGLLEAIPLLIATQVRTQGASGAAEPGALAWILVGTQRTFVSDVTPVVGASSVAFDPTISVLTTGSLLVIGDALVTIYRTEVHESLVAMTSEAWGRSTAHLGYDLDAWRAWHKNEFLPAMATRSSNVSP
ncbi:MAG: hypothetical protein EA379_06640 [Phycisphaerales bacterium]|nr:MAG: hypothetical protein EA379_06640 [Phycisphaerales bacterium]